MTIERLWLLERSGGLQTADAVVRGTGADCCDVPWTEETKRRTGPRRKVLLARLLDRWSYNERLRAISLKWRDEQSNMTCARDVPRRDWASIPNRHSGLQSSAGTVATATPAQNMRVRSLEPEPGDAVQIRKAERREYQS